jgi:hypothetical protein
LSFQRSDTPEMIIFILQARFPFLQERILAHSEFGYDHRVLLRWKREEVGALRDLYTRGLGILAYRWAGVCHEKE